jgi:hypothetical protein
MEAAYELGVPRNTIKSWVRREKEREARALRQADALMAAFARERSGLPGDRVTSQELARLVRSTQ